MPRQFAMDPQRDTPQSIRATGMEGAKAYRMPPNSVVPPFDADDDIMYVESTDGAGFPTVRTFAFQPIEDKREPERRYVTREEFDAAMERLGEAIGNGGWPIRRCTETEPLAICNAGCRHDAPREPRASHAGHDARRPTIRRVRQCERGRIASGHGIDMNAIEQMFG